MKKIRMEIWGWGVGMTRIGQFRIQSLISAMLKRWGKGFKNSEDIFWRKRGKEEKRKRENEKP